MRHLFCTFFAFSIAHAITWSTPSTLYTSASYTGVTPVVAVHPTEQTAMAAWIASGSGTIIYGMTFTSGAWGTATAISTSTDIQASLNLGMNSSGVSVMACDLIDDPDLQLGAAYTVSGAWTPTVAINNFGAINDFIPLNLSTQSDGTSLITWQGSDSRLYAMTYDNGTVGTPYTVSDSGLAVTNSLTCGNRAIFSTTAPSTYSTTLSSSPTNTMILPRIATPASLCLDASGSRAIFGFQDQKSNFFLAAITTEAEFSYSMIATPNTPIAKARVALNTSTGHAAAVWQLTTGQIQAAHYDGYQWQDHITLSTNGTDPSIAFNPLTGHTIVVWADLTAGGTSNTIKTATFQGYSWTSTSTLSATGAVLSDTHIRINSQGNAFVVWARKATSGSKAVIEAVNSL